MVTPLVPNISIIHLKKIIKADHFDDRLRSQGKFSLFKKIKTISGN